STRAQRSALATRRALTRVASRGPRRLIMWALGHWEWVAWISFWAPVRRESTTTTSISVCSRSRIFWAVANVPAVCRTYPRGSTVLRTRKVSESRVEARRTAAFGWTTGLERREYFSRVSNTLSQSTQGAIMAPKRMVRRVAAAQGHFLVNCFIGAWLQN